MALDIQITSIIVLCAVAIVATACIIVLTCYLKRSSIVPHDATFESFAGLLTQSTLNATSYDGHNGSSQSTNITHESSMRTLRAMPLAPNAYRLRDNPWSPLASNADDILLCVRSELPYLSRPENELYIITVQLLANQRPAGGSYEVSES
jgi:hypothetical protein